MMIGMAVTEAPAQVPAPQLVTIPLVVARHDKAVPFDEPTIRLVLDRATAIICAERLRHFPAERRCLVELRLDLFLGNEHPTMDPFQKPVNNVLLPKTAVDALFRLDDPYGFRKVWVVRRISDCPGVLPGDYPAAAAAQSIGGCAESGGNTIVVAFEPEVRPAAGSLAFRAFNRRAWVHRQARRLAHELGHLVRLSDVYPVSTTTQTEAAAMATRLMFYSEGPRGLRLTPDECKNFTNPPVLGQR